jgi:Domain of unknown function (DUF4055)
MPIDTVHPAYSDYLPHWETVRDCAAGWSAIRERGRKYLPSLLDQTERDYEDYKRRARWLGATGRTVDTMLGLLFRKQPLVTLPVGVEDIQNSIDLGGESLFDFTWNISQELLVTGRGGSLVDFSEDYGRPYAVRYRAEDILNWQIGIMNDAHVLLRVVLRESLEGWDERADTITYTQQIRSYQLDELGQCVCQIHEKAEGSGDWALVDTIMPTRSGVPLTFIPFVFHGAENNTAQISRPPIDELAELNIQHYMLSADLGRGNHFCGLPTPYAIAFDIPEGVDLYVGSTKAWVTQNKDARVGYLEFSGAGLASIREEMATLREEMAAMGARMLDRQAGDEAWQTVLMRQSGESASLARISNCVTESMSQVMQTLVWWSGQGAEPAELADVVKIELTTDFVSQALDPTMLQQLISAYLAGIISRETLHRRLQEGEVIDTSVSAEDEFALISADLTRQQLASPRQSSNGQKQQQSALEG